MTNWARTIYALLIILFLVVVRTILIRVEFARRERAQHLELIRHSERQLDVLYEQIEERDANLGAALEDSTQQLAFLQDLISACADSVSPSNAGTSDTKWLDQRMEALGLLSDFTVMRLGALAVDLRGCINELSIYLEREIFPRRRDAVFLNNIPDIPVARNHGFFLVVVIQELMRNAYEHAFQARGTDVDMVSVYADNDYDSSIPGYVFRIVVEDSGMGAPGDPLEPPFQSGGLGLIQTLTQRFNGSIEVTETPGTRVEVTLRFPDRDV